MKPTHLFRFLLAAMIGLFSLTTQAQTNPTVAKLTKSVSKNTAAITALNGSTRLYAETWPTSYTSIMMLGSSITNGFGVADSVRFRTIVGAQLTSTLGRSVTVINGGTDGATMAYMNAILPSLLTANPGIKIVLIESSINDALVPRGASLAQVRGYLLSIIAQVRAVGAVPVLFTTLPSSPNVQTNATVIRQAWRMQVDNTNRQVAREQGLRIIDCGRKNASADIMQGDGIHPNAIGNIMMAVDIVSDFLRY